MARERTNRQPAGPGRTPRRPRSRTTSAAATRTSRPGSGATATGRRRSRLGNVVFTRRALVLLGVVAVLALSYANSLRIMLNQQRDLAEANAQIEQRSAQLADLDAQLQRWRDPAYVKSQARTELGWVMPGEVGYRVIGMDGTVLDDPSDPTTIATTDTADQGGWWDRLSISVAVADSSAGKA